MFLSLNFRINRTTSKVIFLFLVLLPLITNASDKIELKGIRYWSSSEYTRVVIDLSGTVDFTQNRLKNPDRLYFDLKNTELPQEIKKDIPVGDNILRMVRAGQFNHSIVRVVLDLNEFADFNAFILEDPARLVIDVYGKEKVKDDHDLSIKRIVVIDPGHGGHDPGAIGLNGLYEKDVVLDIALKVKKILSSNPLFDVYLTREKDIFVTLEERTAIANKKKADLFVSIHANASPKRKARGIETYLLNWTDSEEGLRVAARENQISIKKMREINRRKDIIGKILGDLERQIKRDESINLAHYIQNSMIKKLDNNEKSNLDLGVKWAPFFVLFGAKMPSVLVEVSFISNPEEERLLSSNIYRQKIAEAIANGINKYFTSIPTFQKVVTSKNQNL